MDELIVSGKKYISSKRAHDLTGYAKDYIGQLARAGKIDATRVGRAWYVEERSILALAGKGEAVEPPQASLQASPFKPVIPAGFYKPSGLPGTWNQIKYLEDHSELLPTLSKKKEELEPKNTAQIVVSSVDTQKPIDNPVKNISVPSTIQIKKPATNVQTRIHSYKAKASFDIPKPQAVSRPVISAVKAIQVRPKLELAPVGSLALLALMLVALSGGMLLAGGGYVALGGPAYTASAFFGIENWFEDLKNTGIFQLGIKTLGDFITILANSFWVFFQSGVDFIKSL